MVETTEKCMLTRDAWSQEVSDLAKVLLNNEIYLQQQNQ